MAIHFAVYSIRYQFSGQQQDALRSISPRHAPSTHTRIICLLGVNFAFNMCAATTKSSFCMTPCQQKTKKKSNDQKEIVKNRNVPSSFDSRPSTQDTCLPICLMKPHVVQRQFVFAYHYPGQSSVGQSFICVLDLNAVAFNSFNKKYAINLIACNSCVAFARFYFYGLKYHFDFMVCAYVLSANL